MAPKHDTIDTAIAMAGRVAGLIAEVQLLGPSGRRAFLQQAFAEWPQTMTALAASSLGRAGGRSRSVVKAKAVAANGHKGGRPRKWKPRELLTMPKAAR